MGINKFIKIGNKMKSIRVNAGLTQQEVADMLKIPRSTYANYEKNLREPNEEIINSFSDIFKINTFDLIYDLNLIKSDIKKYETVRTLLSYFGYNLMTFSNDEIEYFELIHIDSNNSKIINLDEFEKFIDRLKKFIDFEFYNMKK